MPGMPRPNKKAQKIAFDILGTPANLQKNNKSQEKRQVDKRLTFEETVRVR